ncbi:ATP-binding cassette domain-containing protein [Infirmifilum lucidum]|uniref:ATP-binding cassette domain-containing protein n=1 Tax=Infirmifilum lucidum TaxID=2776706 RepID=A0A7L9FG73_9CREN|nr:ATP-binding cassette domain-containing protein [Infirmifilum lucidum]QOJ78697.1 ATP-binding cassette domain-containing protein [Infirmifilum lucidum]
MSRLEVDSLVALVDGNEIVRGVSLTMQSGDKVLLFGPNGAGKTTLLSAIAGLPRVRVASGRVLLDGEDVTPFPAFERARRGIALAYQIPPELTGVRVSRLASLIAERYGTHSLLQRLVDMLEIRHLVERDAFRGFSGGERKRVEVFLTALMKPRFALLDEPDSGVDVDSVKLIARAINFLVQDLGAGVVVVTHTRLLAEYLGGGATGYVFNSGRIECRGDTLEILNRLEKRGFDGACSE